MPEIELSDNAQAAVQHYTNNAGHLGPPATWGEIWDANWGRGKWGIAEQWQIEKRKQDELRHAITNEIAAAYDVPLEEYARQRGMPLTGLENQTRFPREQTVVPHAITTRYLNDIVDTLPEDMQKRIAPYRDVRGLADKEAVKIHDDASRIDRTTYGVGGYLWGSMAGLAAGAVTPEAVVGTLAGGVFGAGAGIGGRLAAGALSNIVPQAAIEPLQFQERARLGFAPTIGESVANVLVGGAVGAGINVLPAVVAPAFRSLSSRFNSFADRLGNDLELRNRARPYDATDYRTMATVAERNEVTGPLPDANPVTHEVKVKAARDAVDSGGSVSPDGEVVPSRPVEVKPAAVDPAKATPEPGPAAAPEPVVAAAAPEPAVTTAGNKAVAENFDSLVDDVVTRAQQRRPDFSREDLHFEIEEDNAPRTVTAKQISDEAKNDVVAFTELKACIEGNK